MRKHTVNEKRSSLVINDYLKYFDSEYSSWDQFVEIKLFKIKYNSNDIENRYLVQTKL